MTGIKRTYPVKVLDKSFVILEALLQKNCPLSLTELSKELGMYPSMLHRMLATMRYWGYVEQDPQTRKYQLGLKVVELGIAKLQRMKLVKEATPYLQKLLTQCNETVHLAVLDKGEVIYLAKEESIQSIRMVSQVGGRAPVHCTALGKVLLAYLGPQDQKRILGKKGLPSFTDNTIIDRKKMREELRKIKEQGFALDIEEYEKGLSCISAPIRNHQGTVIAAVAIAGPIFRLDNSKREELKEVLVEATGRISERLGYKRKNMFAIRK